MVAAATVAVAHAQAPSRSSPGHLAAHTRLSFEQVRLPGDEHMGLLGTSYLLPVGAGWSAGPAVYGALTGQRGGLYVVGGEAAWRRALGSRLQVEAGLYAGGGGGGSAPVGGGLMLRPHLDLLWDFGGWRAGLSASRVRFANGGIDSHQVGLVVDVDHDFRFVPAAALRSPGGNDGATGAGFDRVLAVAGVYDPRSAAQRISGGPLQRRIGFVGVRFERGVGEGLFWGIETNGAASGGGVSGYAEYLATGGIERTLLDRRLTLGARLGLGMGGGGDVDVGGGLLVKAGAYASAALTDDFHLLLEAGLARSPDGSFGARYGSVALNWVLDHRERPQAPVHVVRTEFAGGLEAYRAARRDGSTRTVSNIGWKVNRDLGSSVYLTGQVNSAFDGGAGGYSVGLVGLGVRRDLGSRWRAGGEFMVGAAGGGGIDTGGGALVQPTLYLARRFGPALMARIDLGRIHAVKGPLDATVIGMSLSYAYGVAKR